MGAGRPSGPRWNHSGCSCATKLSGDVCANTTSSMNSMFSLCNASASLTTARVAGAVVESKRRGSQVATRGACAPSSSTTRQASGGSGGCADGSSDGSTAR
eukprot:TRINITY_DN4155_c0_g1_i2.p2 TRINITY_DN4155_c0_g1~~TRINITY_DN4155_c0_g1_i2.p2  ORF type:complete len:101 (-),score=0.41 TRINITY_DN4155_c0_g1_i2:124-426(-)